MCEVKHRDFFSISPDSPQKWKLEMEDWGSAAVWFSVGWCMGTMYKTWRCLKTKDMDSIVCGGNKQPYRIICSET
jgi:hypothetical protein